VVEIVRRAWRRDARFVRCESQLSALGKGWWLCTWSSDVEDLKRALEQAVQV